MTRRYKTAGLLAAMILVLPACGGSTSDEPADTTSGTQPTTTQPATTLTTTTQPTTTLATTTTTTEAPFDLSSLSDEDLQSFNVTCFWATELPRTSGGFLPGPDIDLLRLQIQVGEEAEPFLAAAEGVDLGDVDALRSALGGACDEAGAPTQEFLEGLS